MSESIVIKLDKKNMSKIALMLLTYVRCLGLNPQWRFPGIGRGRAAWM